MSGTFPTSPVFNALNFSSEQNTITSTTDSGKMFATQVDGQRWKFSASFPPMTRADFMSVYAFVMKQRSQKETFSIIPPVISNARGTISGSVDGTASVGATTITLSGGTGSILAGSLIKFDNHDKVYMVVTDNNDVTGNDLVIEPPLRTAVSSTNITYDSVPIKVRLQNDVQQFNTGTDGLYRFEIDVIEAL